MKKLLFVLNSNGIGGAEVSIKRMVENVFLEADVLTMWGHDNVQEAFWDFSHKGKVFQISDKNLSFLQLMFLPFKLLSFFKKNNYEVIQTQLKGADILIGLLVFFRLVKKKTLIASLRNSYDYYYGGGVLNKFIGLLHRKLLQRVFDKVVVISRQNLDLFGSVYGDKLVVIENGINYKSFMHKSISNLNKTVINVAMVGNVKYRKGYDRLIQCFKELESLEYNFIFNVAGSIEDKKLYESLCLQSQSFKNIKLIFHGKISDINQFLIKNDVFLSLSREEGLPISVLEAIATRLPIVLSNIPAHQLIVEDEVRSNVLFDNEQECADRIIAVIQNPSEIIKYQYALLETRFNFWNMCNEYEKLYKGTSGS